MSKDPQGFVSPENFYVGEVARRYDEFREQDRFWLWEELELGRMLESVGLSATGLRVVDCPVGTGRFLPLYQKLGLDAVGIDPSHSMIEEAKQKIGLTDRSSTELIQATTDYLQTKRFAGDVLVCFRLLHLFNDERKKEILKDLAQSGASTVILQIFGCVSPSPRSLAKAIFSMFRERKILNFENLKYILRVRRDLAIARQNKTQSQDRAHSGGQLYFDAYFPTSLRVVKALFKPYGFKLDEVSWLRDRDHFRCESPARGTAIVRFSLRR